MYFIGTISLFIMTIIAMMRVSPMLTLFSLLPLPILSFVIYYVSSRVSKRSIAISKQMSVLTTLAQESYSGIRLIKTYTQEAAMGAQFSEASDDFKQKTLSLARLQAVSGTAIVFLMGISTILTIYVGGRLAIENKISFGNIAEFVIYVGMLAFPVISLGWIASSTQQSAASQKRINEFLDTKPDIADSPNALILPETGGDIDFKNVQFQYPDTGIEALKGISFSLKKGEKLAILGKTGSGKTTIADLLCRLYDPTSGEISINGTPLPQLQLASLRQSIAYVPQDVFLFSDTISNNISFGVPQTNLPLIQEYAKYAAIHNELEALPQGYETVVGERGVMLSGGQKQRISLARAFIRQSPIIILDDCLSAVDANTEQQILNYLETALQSKTTLLITHRVHYLKDFDQIIVLNDGQIVEQGKHSDLLKNGGYYADLYQLQQADN
jgi:ATP-binding cassette subfamily B protein